MELAETPEKNATEKLAPVIADSRPILISGRARVASLCVQFRLSMQLAMMSPMEIKKVILNRGQISCGHICAAKLWSINS